MNPDWEKLLQSGGLEVPADFTARVMSALPTRQRPPIPRWQKLVGVMAATAASLLGLIEIAAALLSAWAMSPAF